MYCPYTLKYESMHPYLKIAFQLEPHTKKKYMYFIFYIKNSAVLPSVAEGTSPFLVLYYYEYIHII